MTETKHPDAADVAEKHGPEALKRLHENGGEPVDVLPEEPAEPSPLERAQTIAASLPELTREDAGAPFLPEKLEALETLHRLDRAAFVRAREALRGLTNLRDLEASLKERRAASQVRVVSGPEERPSLDEILPDAPLPPGLSVPAGWHVSENGVFRVRPGEAGPMFHPVTRAPVVIVGRLRDAQDGQEALRLLFRRGNRWAQTTADRGALMDARRLVTLASVGVPVTSGRAGDLADFLDAFEHENLGRLRSATVAAAFGWQPIGPEPSGFLWGRNWITVEGIAPAKADLDETDADGWAAERVYFRGHGPGEEQRAGGLYSSGTLEEWSEAAAGVADFPRVIVAVYASLAAPLLAILRTVQNPLVDWAFATSSGKSSTLRLGASIWGNPNEGTPESFIRSWDATATFFERDASLLSGLPLILDDTKRADPRRLASAAYAFAHGQGRGRGNRGDGQRQTRAFRGVLLTSGEAPLTSYTTDGGTRARVLGLWGPPPFGRADDTTAPVVEELRAGLAENFGHAGPGLVGWLLQRRDRWDKIREAFRELRRDYVGRADGNPIAGRLAEHFALFDLAARLSHEALTLPWTYQDTLGGLWEALAAEDSEANRAEAALSAALSWAYAHQEQFFERHREDLTGNPLQPPGGWAGRWPKEGTEPFLGFLPTVLHQVLRTCSFEPEAAVKTWQANGWLDTEPKRVTRTVRIPGGKPRMVVILGKRS